MSNENPREKLCPSTPGRHSSHEYMLLTDGGWIDYICPGREEPPMRWSHATPSLPSGAKVERGDVIGHLGGPGPDSVVTLPGTGRVDPGHLRARYLLESAHLPSELGEMVPQSEDFYWNASIYQALVFLDGLDPNAIVHVIVTGQSHASNATAGGAE